MVKLLNYPHYLMKLKKVQKIELRKEFKKKIMFVKLKKMTLIKYLKNQVLLVLNILI